jgi:hypothetical protein
MSVYRPKGSRIYWMDFHFDGTRIRESTHQPGITRARKVEDKRRQGLRDGATGIRKPERPPLFSVAAAEWMEAKRGKWSPRTLDIAQNSMKHLAPAFGKKLLVDIEAADVSRYQKARLEQGASARTVNIEVGCVRSIMARAGLWARIQSHVEMLPERQDVGHALTSEEESAYSRSAADPAAARCCPSLCSRSKPEPGTARYAACNGGTSILKTAV